MDSEGPVYNVVVFDGASTHDWPALFGELPGLPGGGRLRVVQVSWVDCELTVYGDAAGPLLMCHPVRDLLRRSPRLTRVPFPRCATRTASARTAK